MQPALRDLCVAMGVTALFFGVGVLTLGGLAPAASLPTQTPERPPPVLAGALADMALHASPGIAIVLPEDPAERDRLRRELGDLVSHRRGEDCALLLEAAWVVAEAREVGALPGETAVFLDRSGRRLFGTTKPVTADSFASVMTSFLHDNGLLAGRVASRDRTETRRLLADVDAQNWTVSQRALAALADGFDVHGPAVIASLTPGMGVSSASAAGRVIQTTFERRMLKHESGERPLIGGVRLTPGCSLISRVNGRVVLTWNAELLEDRPR